MFRKFSTDTSGTIAPIFAIAILPIMLSAGAAIDYSRYHDYSTKLQSAADAAALAGVTYEGNKRKRKKLMKEYLEANLSSEVYSTISRKKFRYKKKSKHSKIKLTAKIPMTFMQIAGFSTKKVTIRSEAKLGGSVTTVFDMVMCVDGTGSMQPTIDAIKSNIMSFETDLNSEMRRRRLPEFSSIRAKVIVYRDYGGNNIDAWNGYYHVSRGGHVDKSSAGVPNQVWRPAGDARNYGDDEPMVESNYFNLPSDQASLKSYLDGQPANGGGDAPEAGFECVNKAMSSDWLKVGDSAPITGNTIKKVYSTIVLWTDIDAQPLSFRWSLRNPNYPTAAQMPRNQAALKAKWETGTDMAMDSRLLVTFMPNGISKREWNKIRGWGDYFNGGTLNDGNTRLTSKLADAIATIPTAKMAVLVK